MFQGERAIRSFRPLETAYAACVKILIKPSGKKFFFPRQPVKIEVVHRFISVVDVEERKCWAAHIFYINAANPFDKATDEGRFPRT